MNKKLYIENNNNNLINKYNVLSYIDDISSNEKLYIDELIKEELSKDNNYINTLNIKDNNDNNYENKILDEKNSISLNNKILDHELINNINIIDSIKKSSIDIQYENINQINLKLLKEYGNSIWDNVIKNLKNYKKYLEKKEKTLKKDIKQISINRKNKQLIFNRDHLNPLINDLIRIKNENKILLKKIIQNKKEKKKI